MPGLKLGPSALIIGGTSTGRESRDRQSWEKKCYFLWCRNIRRATQSAAQYDFAPRRPTKTGQFPLPLPRGPGVATAQIVVKTKNAFSRTDFDRGHS